MTSAHSSPNEMPFGGDGQMPPINGILEVDGSSRDRTTGIADIHATLASPSGGCRMTARYARLFGYISATARPRHFRHRAYSFLQSCFDERRHMTTAASLAVNRETGIEPRRMASTISRILFCRRIRGDDAVYSPRVRWSCAMNTRRRFINDMYRIYSLSARDCLPVSP